MADNMVGQIKTATKPPIKNTPKIMTFTEKQTGAPSSKGGANIKGPGEKGSWKK